MIQMSVFGCKLAMDKFTRVIADPAYDNKCITTILTQKYDYRRRAFHGEED